MVKITAYSVRPHRGLSFVDTVGVNNALVPSSLLAHGAHCETITPPQSFLYWTTMPTS